MNNNKLSRTKTLWKWLPIVAVILFWISYLLPGGVAEDSAREVQEHLADTAFSEGVLFWFFVFSPTTLMCLIWGYFGQWIAKRSNLSYVLIVAAMILGSFFPPVGILAIYAVMLLSVQYISDQKNEFFRLPDMLLPTFGYVVALYVLFLEISVCRNLSSVFNLGLLACVLPMLYWLSTAVCLRQPQRWTSWLLPVFAIALTVAAVILGQLNGYVFLWMVLPLVVALGLYNHCCKHLSNKIIGLSLCLLLASCSDRSLEQALQQSGANRSQLEQVLRHYSEHDSLSLHLQAARFLIRHMPEHRSLEGGCLLELCEGLDSLHPEMPLPVRRVLLKQ